MLRILYLLSFIYMEAPFVDLWSCDLEREHTSDPSLAIVFHPSFQPCDWLLCSSLARQQASLQTFPHPHDFNCQRDIWVLSLIKSGLIVDPMMRTQIMACSLHNSQPNVPVILQSAKQWMWNLQTNWMIPKLEILSWIQWHLMDSSCM